MEITPPAGKSFALPLNPAAGLTPGVSDVSSGGVVDLVGNLNSRAPGATNQFDYTASIQLGFTVGSTTYKYDVEFQNLGDGYWGLAIYNAADARSVDGTTVFVSGALADETLQFDDATGALVGATYYPSGGTVASPDNVVFTPAAGAAPLDLDIAGLTQLAAASSLTPLEAVLDYHPSDANPIVYGPLPSDNLANGEAAGTGRIQFDPVTNGVGETLIVDSGAPANLIEGFAIGDVIELADASATTLALISNASGQLIVPTANGGSLVLNFAGLAPFSPFAMTPLSGGGAAIRLEFDDMDREQRRADDRRARRGRPGRSELKLQHHRLVAPRDHGPRLQRERGRKLRQRNDQPALEFDIDAEGRLLQRRLPGRGRPRHRRRDRHARRRRLVRDPKRNAEQRRPEAPGAVHRAERGDGGGRRPGRHRRSQHAGRLHDGSFGRRADARLGQRRGRDLRRRQRPHRHAGRRPDGGNIRRHLGRAECRRARTDRRRDDPRGGPDGAAKPERPHRRRSRRSDDFRTGERRQARGRRPIQHAERHPHHRGRGRHDQYRLRKRRPKSTSPGSPTAAARRRWRSAPTTTSPSGRRRCTRKAARRRARCSP